MDYEELYTKLMKRMAKPGHKYDAIVCGGGPAGIGAALAAAMNGASTLIIESRSQFGGTATAMMWMPFNCLYKDNNDSNRGGVHDVLDEKIHSYGAKACATGKRTDDFFNNIGNLKMDSEYLKLALFELFEQYGIDYLLHSPTADVIMEDNKVVGVTVNAKQGKLDFYGKVVIDATGDGDVLEKAGCEFEEGEPNTGFRAQATLGYAYCNVDTARLKKWLDENKGALKDKLTHARENGYHLPEWYDIYFATMEGVVSINSGTSNDLQLNFLESENLTLLERIGLDQAYELLRFFKDYGFEGFENASLIKTGGFVAVRETRRLKGEYILTNDDVLNGNDFYDAVASKYGGSDPIGDIRPLTVIAQGAKYPYRSLLPREIDGLMAAGRCASASYMGHYGGKSMGNMLSIGQAAGVAAALCVQNGTQPRKLDYKLVQKKLAEMGVTL